VKELELSSRWQNETRAGELSRGVIRIQKKCSQVKIQTLQVGSNSLFFDVCKNLFFESIFPQSWLNEHPSPYIYFNNIYHIENHSWSYFMNISSVLRDIVFPTWHASSSFWPLTLSRDWLHRLSMRSRESTP
jgi:hypothetical protein